MPEFTLDLASLRRAVEPDPRIPVKGNEHRMEKVAFDVFRLDSEPETLWKVQSDDDGNEFLVRCYDEPEQDMRAESGWSVDIDRQAANLTVSYRDLPVHRLRASDYGARTPSDARVLQRVVRQKLAADAGFAARLLASLPSAKTAALASTFPELRALAAGDESAQSAQSAQDELAWVVSAADGALQVRCGGRQVAVLAGSDYGISTPGELEILRQVVSEKVASDPAFVRQMLLAQADDQDVEPEKKTWDEKPQLWDLDPGQKFRFGDSEGVWTVGELGMLVSPSGKEVKPDKIDLYMRVTPLDDEGNSLVAQKPRKPMSEEELAKMDEWFGGGSSEKADDGDYKAYFEKMMDAEGIDSPAELSDEQARAFFRKVDRGWKSKSEKRAFLAKSGMLAQRHNDKTDRLEWALVSKSKHGGEHRVLKWFGPQKPSHERFLEEERRVQYFKHHAEDAPGVL